MAEPVALATLVRDDVLFNDEPSGSELLLYQLWMLLDKRLFLRGTLAGAIAGGRDLMSEIETQEKQLRLLKAELHDNKEQLRELDEALVTGHYDLYNDSL